MPVLSVHVHSSLLRTCTCAYMEHASHGASLMELEIGSRITFASLGRL